MVQGTGRTPLPIPPGLAASPTWPCSRHSAWPAAVSLTWQHPLLDTVRVENDTFTQIRAAFSLTWDW